MTSVNILVVEDEEIIALLLKRKLEDLGYAVTDMVATGEAAIEMVNHRPPELILMDITLAGKLDGIATAAITTTMGPGRGAA